MKQHYSTTLTRQFFLNFKLFTFLIATLTVLRCAFISFFIKNIGKEATFLDYFLAFLKGVIVDARLASFFALPFFALGFLGANGRLTKWIDSLRLWGGSVFIGVSVLLAIGNMAFFKEYHEPFNHWIYGLVYDDFNAILKTIWSSYPVVWIGIGAAYVTYLLIAFYIKYIDFDFHVRLKRPYLQACLIFGLLVVMVAARGSVGKRPLQRKDLAVTRDALLNHSIINPHFALYYAISDHKKRTDIFGLEAFWPTGDIGSALKVVFPEKEIFSRNIDDYLKKMTGKKVLSERPKHIFVVVMESQDTWPLLKKYRSFDLNPCLMKIGEEGVCVKSFLSAGPGTMHSVNAIITGLPDARVYTNYQLSSKSPYPTSITTQFKGLGYETNLFYGGYLSWQKIGTFAKNQGFDHVYGGGNIGLDKEHNEWGVHDKELFEFILNKIDRDKPTFNLILTTSYHPPYDVDLEAEGWDRESLPQDLAEMYDGDVPLKSFGHAWYADKCVGEFLQKSKAKFGSVLFAITGDHWSRKFLNVKPSLFESKSVPLILWGDAKLMEFNGKAFAGSHIDIGPTILELIADEGHEYYSLGRDIFARGGSNRVGFGAGAIITPGETFRVREADQQLTDYFNALHSIGWWRIMSGSKY